MKISHEIPCDLLEKSLEFNDYEYSLLHLMHIPEYKEFYKKTHRTHYLDNSAYEYQFIDGGFDPDYFYSNINDLKPTHVIVPDVIGCCDKTIRAYKNFDTLSIPENTKLIGVAQGETLEDLLKCSRFLAPRVNILAVVFHSPAYQKLFPYDSLAIANAKGRVKFVRELIKEGVTRLHLIGMSLPVELTMYTQDEKKYIVSIDTANPFQYAATFGEYCEFYNILEKPKYVLSETAILKKTDDIIYKKFMNNVAKFRMLARG